MILNEAVKSKNKSSAKTTPQIQQQPQAQQTPIQNNNDADLGEYGQPDEKFAESITAFAENIMGKGQDNIQTEK